MTGQVEGRPVLGHHLSCVIGQERWHLDSVWHSKDGVRYHHLIAVVETCYQGRKEVGSAKLHRLLRREYILAEVGLLQGRQFKERRWYRHSSSQGESRRSNSRLYHYGSAGDEDIISPSYNWLVLLLLGGVVQHWIPLEINKQN